MIIRFEEQTHELTEYELSIFPTIMTGLLLRVGKSKAVSNKHMVEKMKAAGYKVSQPRIRKIINYIRVQGFIPNLVANSKGYYIATAREDAEEYIKSLKQREASIRSVRQALEEQIIKL